MKELTDFALRARLSMFESRVDPGSMPSDLERFAETYLDGTGCFLAARDQAGVLTGTIAYRSYDHRFAQLAYENRRVVEIVRLFVIPSYRRKGLAAALFNRLLEHAVQANIDVLYLHSHPFLPGAIEFWRKHGFSVLCVDADPVWQTTHMERVLG